MDSSARRGPSGRAWLSSVRWPVVARLLIGVVGLALLVLGAERAAAVAGGTGALILVVAGAILLICAFVLDRIGRVSVSTSSVDLWLTTQVSDRGAPEAAAILQRTRLGSFAESYALVHDELTVPEYIPARLHLQDLLVQRSASVAKQERFDPQEVRRLFDNGSVFVRVLVLGLMQGDRSLADADTIVSAVTRGRSRNETYQGMKLAKLCWNGLAPRDRKEIQDAIHQADFRTEGERWKLAQEVLGLSNHQPMHPQD